MRMWMLPPEGMCRKHLLGEHVEMHMFVGSIIKNVSMKGYLKNGLLQPADLRARHDALVEEMENRGYNHNSPLKEYEPQLFTSLTGEEWDTKVDQVYNLEDLTKRCPDCAARMASLGKERGAHLYGSWEAEKLLPQVSAMDLAKTPVTKGRTGRSDPNY